MICSGDVYSHELGEVVLAQGREDAFLEAVVVGYDISDIFQGRGQWGCVGWKAEEVPLRTSFISPGGDWRRKLQAASIRSFASMVRRKIVTCHNGLVHYLL